MLNPIRGAVRRLTQAVGGWLRASSFDRTFVDWLRAGSGDAGDVGQAMTAASAAYAGVNRIAQTVRGLPLVLHRAGAPDQIVTAGPAFDLLRRPSPDCTGDDFREQWVGHYVEGGEAHTLLEMRPGTGRVRGIAAVGRRQMSERLNADGRLLWWDYAPLGASRVLTILPEENAYRRMFNPYDPVRGLGPLQAAALALKQNNLAGRLNVQTLGNGGAPSGFYAHPGNPTEEQRRELVEKLKARHNARNAFGLLWGGMTWQAVAQSAADLQLAELMKLSANEILNVLGVPPVIVAMFSDAKYDVADKSIEIFLLFTIAPICSSFAETLNVLVLPRVEPGVECYVDMSQHPVMQRIGREKIDALAKALQTGIPFNEGAKLVGLRLAPQPSWGDKSLLPSTLTAADEIAAGLDAPPETTPPDQAPTPTPDQSAATDGDAREQAAIQEAARAEVRIEERLIRAAATKIKARYRAYFLKLQRETLARLRKAMSGQARQSAATPEEIAAIVQRVLWNVAAEQVTLRKMAGQYFPDSVVATLRAELERLGITGDDATQIVDAARGGKLLSAYTRVKKSKIGSIERVTRERVIGQLTEGLAKGETVSELSERVRVTLGENAARANRIARTESGQAVSLGRFVAARESGAAAKAWLTGSNPRETHVQAGRDYGVDKAIEIDEAFRVGGDALMFPRDARGSAAEIVNCNCVMVTVRKPAKDQEGAAA